jgi:uncharacterized membrane protein
MNAINKAAPNPLFMLALFGTGAVSTALSIVALRHLDEPWATYLVIGSALYLVCVVVTMAYHVPHNDALARIDPRAPNAGNAWSRYHSPWTACNHLRTVTALGSTTSFILALRAR